MEKPTPTRQLRASELLARNIALPYWVDDAHLDAQVNYHLTVVVLDDWELEALTIAARKHSAKLLPNPLDNRDGRLDYPATPKEKHAFIRHMLLNRTDNNKGQGAGYQNGYDNILHKIEKKGIDVEARQRTFKEQVCALIATHYGDWARKEGEYYLWRCETERRMV